MMNKSVKETLKIANNRLYIKISTGKEKYTYLTGGEAINSFLERINLEKTGDKKRVIYNINKNLY